MRKTAEKQSEQTLNGLNQQLASEEIEPYGCHDMPESISSSTMPLSPVQTGSFQQLKLTLACLGKINCFSLSTWCLSPVSMYAGVSERIFSVFCYMHPLYMHVSTLPSVFFGVSSNPAGLSLLSRSLLVSMGVVEGLQCNIWNFSNSSRAGGS